MHDTERSDAHAPRIALSADFTMPVDSVTSTIAILGKKGRGKTHTASVLAEELMDAGCLICVIDPTGVWHGLRSSANGREAGFPVVILGGEHADVPLRADQGAAIAELIAQQRFPAVLDLSLMRKAERRTFTADFLETLYWRNRDPLHLIIDEADEFAPQRAPAGIERLLGATEDIVRRGRVRGLGVTLCSQRAAALHKTVLSQIDSLIALGVTAPQDVNTMMTSLSESRLGAIATTLGTTSIEAIDADLRAGRAEVEQVGRRDDAERVVVHLHGDQVLLQVVRALDASGPPARGPGSVAIVLPYWRSAAWHKVTARNTVCPRCVSMG